MLSQPGLAGYLQTMVAVPAMVLNNASWLNSIVEGTMCSREVVRPRAMAVNHENRKRIAATSRLRVLWQQQTVHQAAERSTIQAGEMIRTIVDQLLPHAANREVETSHLLRIRRVIWHRLPSKGYRIGRNGRSQQPRELSSSSSTTTLRERRNGVALDRTSTLPALQFPDNSAILPLAYNQIHQAYLGNQSPPTQISLPTLLPRRRKTP